MIELKDIIMNKDMFELSTNLLYWHCFVNSPFHLIRSSSLEIKVVKEFLKSSVMAIVSSGALISIKNQLINYCYVTLGVLNCLQKYISIHLFQKYLYHVIYFYIRSNKFLFIVTTQQGKGYRHFLYSYLCDQPIWQSLRFWNAAFFDAVQCERARKPVCRRWVIPIFNHDIVYSTNQFMDTKTHRNSLIFGCGDTPTLMVFFEFSSDFSNKNYVLRI